MNLTNHFDFTAQGRRPTAAQIVACWKRAGRPDTFSVQYGETEAEFTYRGAGSIRGWDDSGNGCRGVDRAAVVKALNEVRE
jgi:hypothetical protein